MIPINLLSQKDLIQCWIANRKSRHGITHFNTSDRWFLYFRMLLCFLTISVIVLLIYLAYLLAANIINGDKLFQGPDVMPLIVLTTFLWSSSTFLMIDGVLHFWYSWKLLSAISKSAFPIKSTRFLRVWSFITFALLLVECSIVIRYFECFCNNVGLIVVMVPASHLISLLTLLIYVLRIETYFQALRLDIQYESLILKRANENTHGFTVIPKDIKDSSYI